MTLRLVPDDDAPRETKRSATAARRRTREAGIVAATRELFDTRGAGEVQIEDIARTAGINRAILYRHFTGKEEIVALTLVSYLDELRAEMNEAIKPAEGAGSAARPVAERLAAAVGAFVDYGAAHPAFVDCAQALMRRSGQELLEEISERALFRLGRAMTGCLSLIVRLFEEGTATGEFAVADPTLLANTLYASGLGAVRLAHIGILVAESAPGVPRMGAISAAQVSDYLTTAVLAQARG